jgi:beta-phosphoglucomutase
MTFKGYIFDMDGVVVDNHAYHFKAWMEFAKAHQFELNEEIYREKFNGKTNKDLFRMIFNDPGEEEMKRYTEEKESLYQKIYLPHMTPHKGLVDFLTELKSKKKKIALGTSAPPGNVDFILDHLSLRKYFDIIVDGTMVTKGKPDPEVYRQASARLGLEPKDCVVFEDALAGLEAGERAGCEIIGVATSHRPSELAVLTDKIIIDFTEVKRLIKL